MFTEAYVDLMFAWGHARLGELEQTQPLLSKANSYRQNAPRSAPADQAAAEICDWLVEAFTFRIEQAASGEPHAGPLPSDLRARIEFGGRSFEFDARWSQYVVDVVRSFSLVLEPTEVVDPFQPWRRHDPQSGDMTGNRNPVLIWRSPYLKHPDVELARTHLDEALSDSKVGPFAQSLAIGAFTTALGHVPWRERAVELKQVIARLLRFPNTFTTAAYYSRTHLAIIDRIVLAIASDTNAGTDSTLYLPPATEFASRREALLEARARLVEWGRPDWGPAFRSS